MRKAELFKRGYRYWMHGPLIGVDRVKYIFYSSHKWPFYKGAITLPEKDNELAYQYFLEWCP